jgi:hypothetical protein
LSVFLFEAFSKRSFVRKRQANLVRQCNLKGSTFMKMQGFDF